MNVENLKQQEEEELIMPMTNFTGKTQVLGNTNSNLTSNNNNINPHASNFTKYDHLLQNTKSTTMENKYSSNVNTLLSKYFK